MQSLRDMLLKAGLVSEDQAKKAESEIVIKRAPPPPRAAVERQARDVRSDARPEPRAPERRGGGRGGPPIRREAPRAPDSAIPKLPPLPGSRAYQQEESRKQLELTKRVRELVLAEQVTVDAGATVFYFMTRKKLLRRLELTEAQAAQLESGQLAVVERPDPDRIEHSLVPSAAADQLLEFFPKAVRFYNRADNPIGFMSDDDVKTQQDVEASGESAETDAPADAATGAGPQDASGVSDAPAGEAPDAPGGAQDGPVQD